MTKKSKFFKKIQFLLAIIVAVFAITFVQDAHADTVTLSASDDGSVRKPGLLSLCSTPTKDDTSDSIRIGNSNSPMGVYRGFLEWNITSIDDSAIITNVGFSWGRSVDSTNDPDITELTLQPSIAEASILYDVIGSGSVYVDEGASGTFPGGTSGTGTIDLGPIADSTLQSRLYDNWFAIGFVKDENENILCTPLFDGYDAIATNEAGTTIPTLIVTFTIPTPVLPIDNGTITIQTMETSLVAGASYTIIPNPTSGSGMLNVTDGGSADEDGLVNGIIKILQVPIGSYTISQSIIPSGFSTLVNSTILSVHQTQINQTVTFNEVSESTNLSQLPSVSITSPSLNSTSFNTLIASNATIVSDISQTMDDVTDLPSLIVAGASNITAIDSASELQSSLQVDTVFAELTSGSDIISAFGLPQYTLPILCDLVSVIPSIVTLGTDFQIVATPPLHIMPCQKIIIPVTDLLIPSFGGLKKMQLAVSPTAITTNVTLQEWFVVEIRNTIPSTIPSLSSSGIDNVLELFIAIKYPFEEIAGGYDWSNSENFAESPTVTLFVDKPTSNSTQTDSSGCPIVDAFFFNTISNNWTQSDVSVISTMSISSDKCQIVIQPEHFSRLSVASRLNDGSSSSGSSSSGSSSSGSSSSSNTSSDSSSNFNSQSSTTSSTSTISDEIQTVMKDDTNNQVQDDPTTIEITPVVPNWVKHNAKWWSTNSMTDQDFAKTLVYLKEKIMNMHEPKPTSLSDPNIPSWVKDNARWWADDKISDDDFVYGIQYLIKKEVIIV